MSEHQHGLFIDAERHQHALLVRIKVTGKLTKADFKELSPKLDAALYATRASQVSILVDISEFDGWEWRAVFDDISLGLRLGAEFNRVALYGQKSWQGLLARSRSWITGSKIKAFTHYDDAFKWSLAS